MADIELVIKINDKEYLDIKKHPGDITSYITTVHLYDAIRNGTPLPKGHDRLVEARAVVKALFDKKTIDDVQTIVEADKE